MSEDLYKVNLKGYSPGKGEYYVEEAFAKLFKIKQEKARELLSSAPTVIKENISLEQANKYQAAIEETGASCEIESMNYDLGGLSLE